MKTLKWLGVLLGLFLLSSCDHTVPLKPFKAKGPIVDMNTEAEAVAHQHHLQARVGWYEPEKQSRQLLILLQSEGSSQPLYVPLPHAQTAYLTAIAFTREDDLLIGDSEGRVSFAEITYKDKEPVSLGAEGWRSWMVGDTSRITSLVGYKRLGGDEIISCGKQSGEVWSANLDIPYFRRLGRLSHPVAQLVRGEEEGIVLAVDTENRFTQWAPCMMNVQGKDGSEAEATLLQQVAVSLPLPVKDEVRSLAYVPNSSMAFVTGDDSLYLFDLTLRRLTTLKVGSYEKAIITSDNEGGLNILHEFGRWEHKEVYR